MVFTQAVIAFFFGTYAVEPVRREDVLSYDLLRLSLTGLFALLALAAAGLGGVYVWGWRNYGLGDEKQ